jgi:hypothetical protein
MADRDRGAPVARPGALGGARLPDGATPGRSIRGVALLARTRPHVPVLVRQLPSTLRRTAAGYDTQDFELDIVVSPDGSWRVKDLELIPQRVAEGYISSDVAERVVRAGEELVAELATGQRRWNEQWANWTPPSSWRDPTLPLDWNEHDDSRLDL